MKESTTENNSNNLHAQDTTTLQLSIERTLSVTTVSIFCICEKLLLMARVGQSGPSSGNT